MTVENKGLQKRWNVTTQQYEYLTFQQLYELDVLPKTGRPLVPIMVKFEDDDDKAVAFAVKVLFENGTSDFDKVLWRMGSGSYSKCYQIAGELMANRYSLELGETTFDLACAEVNDGCEVEWISE